ncbi:MAG: hypothetical protein JSV65_12055 [Armatimonadota bacterium]|nr:MAG: hypothetical protein JSV65_12055 [Armatimonadota bacterium]
MFRIGVAVAAVSVALVIAAAPAVAQITIPAPIPVPGAGQQATPVVSYIWYEPSRDEVESGKGVELSAVFGFLGPVKGRIQWTWPQSGDYSNLGLAGIIGWGSPIYFGAGYGRTGGHETSPVSRDVSEYQSYAFAGLTSRSQLYSLLLEVERSFGDELKGTTLKAGITMSW